LFRREPYGDEAAGGGDRALANPPPYSYVSALVTQRTRRRPSLAHPTLVNHFHARSTSKRALQARAQRAVSSHDDEQFDTGKGSRRKRFEKTLLVDSTDAVGRLWVFQRFAYTKVTKASRAAAPSTKYIHRSDTTCASAVPEHAKGVRRHSRAAHHCECMPQSEWLVRTPAFS